MHAVEGEAETRWKYSAGLHCADCDISYPDPTPSLFSFNSPIGACDLPRLWPGDRRGFRAGDPDESKSSPKAPKPGRAPASRECQDDLAKMAKKHGVAMDIPFRDLPEDHRRWVLEGDEKWKSRIPGWPRYWYGVRHFFDWLETKAYKMHIRVLLSRYRSYTECPACHGARGSSRKRCYGACGAVRREEAGGGPADRQRTGTEQGPIPTSQSPLPKLAISELARAAHRRCDYLRRGAGSPGATGRSHRFRSVDEIKAACATCRTWASAT